MGCVFLLVGNIKLVLYNFNRDLLIVLVRKTLSSIVILKCLN